MNILSVTYSSSLEEAGEALASGEVIIIPTDTVYGLAALAENSAAVGKLADIKGRSQQQPIAVLVADFEQAKSMVGELSEAANRAFESLADAFWPGSLTMVLPAASSSKVSSPVVSTGKYSAVRQTIGIRCPDYEWVRELAKKAGPIAATSANQHGEPPCRTVQEAQAAIGNQGIVLAVDAGQGGAVASTVVSLDENPANSARRSSSIGSSASAFEAEIIREGVISEEQIVAVLGNSPTSTQ